MRRQRARVALLALVTAVNGACNRYVKARGQLEPGVDVTTYRYAILDSRSAGANEVTAALVDRGFQVVIGRIEWLDRYEFSPRTVLFANCTDLGRPSRDLGASKVARASCQVLDAATHQVLYNGIGEHSNFTGDWPDISKAAALALQDLPRNGRIGGVTEVVPPDVFRERRR